MFFLRLQTDKIIKERLIKPSRYELKKLLKLYPIKNLKDNLLWTLVHHLFLIEYTLDLINRKKHRKE